MLIQHAAWPKRLVILVLSLGLTLTTASSAWAKQEPANSDPRWTEVSRVEEVITVGVVGESGSRLLENANTQAANEGMVLDLAAISAEMEATSAATCWWAQPEYKVYNGFGNLATWSWYYIEWCASGGVITSVPSFFCDGLGAQGWEYRGCTKNRGSTGYTTMKVNGTWTFRFGCCGAYTYRTHKVDATHRANGTYSGTWWFVQ
jgi:hypothetical protein